MKIILLTLCLSALAGTWKATVDMGGGPMTMTTQYRVVSGGSAIEERLFADTPKEMITIYHDKDGKEKNHHPFKFERVKS